MKVMKKGTTVRLIQPVIVGEIVGGKLSEDGTEIDYEVEFVAPHGEKHVRHFDSEQLEAVETPSAQEKASLDALTLARGKEKADHERFEALAAEHRKQQGETK